MHLTPHREIQALGVPNLSHHHATATDLFHFGRQIGLSVSSALRALAYSISASRAASHRSALVNSWVEMTAPFATPSQLTMIRMWVTVFFPHMTVAPEPIASASAETPPLIQIKHLRRRALSICVAPGAQELLVR